MEYHFIKYPRTQHLEGSRLQDGDHDLSQVKYSEIQGKYIVIEEKIDGANAGFGLDAAGELMLQCRGHLLDGGGKERQFNLFKSWANHHKDAFLERFEDRYIVYGEWMRAKHTIFYDALPHLFFEFDIWDRHQGQFLSTAARKELIRGLPIVQVPVLYEGIAPKHMKEFKSYVRPSMYKTENWRDNLIKAAIKAGVEPERAIKESDKSDFSEGVYIKIETDEHTVGRLKWVRRDFTQHIIEGGRHWSEGPMIENTMDPTVDLFAMPYLNLDFDM